MKHNIKGILIVFSLLVISLSWNRRPAAVKQENPSYVATDNNFLELVNAEYSISGEPKSGAVISAWPSVPVLTTDVALDQTALEAVNEMLAAAKGVGISGLYVSSGYRGYNEQKRTYEESADKSYAQPAGHSEHQTGLAADIMVTGLTQYAMGSSPGGKWLAGNSWRYGLIIRYPEGKQGITGIRYEPWHLRYTGQPHAWYCYEKGLCLEEYIQFLKDKGGYQTELDGVTYSVLYETPENGIIHVPDGQKHSVSGDNTGGYIVTAWE